MKNLNISELKDLITDSNGKMYGSFKRPQFLKTWRKMIMQNDDKLQIKQRLYNNMVANIQNGLIGIIVHNRCHVDHVNWSHTIITEASIMKLQRMMDDYDVEITRTYEIVTPNIANSHDGYERDLIMEAHEDGHAHVVYA